MGGLGKRRPQETDESMCHVWPDLVVRGIGGTAVVRTRQLVKDARAVNVLAYNGGCSRESHVEGTHSTLCFAACTDTEQHYCRICDRGPVSVSLARTLFECSHRQIDSRH